jgi:hypothetical protein
MSPSHDCKIQRLNSKAPLTLRAEIGRSTIIVGANGSGKTRLGVRLEQQLPTELVRRIAAQKSLALSNEVTLTSFERAGKLLQFGYAHIQGNVSAEQLAAHRWGNNPAIHLLHDYDALLQALFAEQNLIAVQHLREREANPNTPIPTPRLRHLQNLWEHLLPHRELKLRETSIEVAPRPSVRSPDSKLVSTVLSNANPLRSEAYSGSEMSDGERAIFYFIGQCLLAPTNGIIIIDEPEGHVHKAILGRLWDAIEGARPDCAFIYITHDLDFAATRPASAKYFLRSFDPTHGGSWDIEELPQDTGLPEHVVTVLVGSRKPVLFVEGTGDSLDLTIYRSHYSAFTIVPIEACDHVIHSVGSYRQSPALHRLGAVRGLVDADDRTAEEIRHLQTLGVYVLPVAEVENLLLLPNVFLALAEAFYCADPPKLLAELTADITTSATADLEAVCARYTRRRIDRQLKLVDINAKDLATLQTRFTAELAKVDPATVFTEVKAKLEQCIRAKDLPGLLALYDNKGLLARAAIKLGFGGHPRALLDKVSRLLGSPNGSKLRDELSKVLPPITV